jgi:uncharacterized membrane protein YkvI
MGLPHRLQRYAIYKKKEKNAMKKKKSLSWQIGAAYIGTVIGAGFASGQEIMQFFTSYGTLGYVALLLSGVLFFLCGYAIFYLSKHYDTHDYNSFIIKICGPRLSMVYDCIITLFLFFGASIMFSGSGALFEESIGISRVAGVLVIAVISLFVVLHSVEGILKINSVVVPVMMTVILFFLFKTILASDLADLVQNAGAVYSGNFFKPSFSLIFYCSYNLVLSLGVLTAFSQDISDLKILKKGAFIGGIGLTLLAAALNSCLLLYLPAIMKLSIPVLYIASMQGAYLKYAVLLCIWFEICTTAVSNIFSLSKRVAKNRPAVYKPASLFLVIACIPLSLLDFKSLISFFYPLFGALCMFLIALILIRFFRMRFSEKPPLKKALSYRNL